MSLDLVIYISNVLFYMRILLISVDSRHPEIYEDVSISCIASLLYLISPCLRRQLLKYCKMWHSLVFRLFLSVLSLPALVHLCTVKLLTLSDDIC